MFVFKPSFLPAILYFVIVTILLVLPGSAFPQENWLSKIWFDKWVHVGLFALLVIVWSRALLKYTWKTYPLAKAMLWIAFAALLYGTGMEFVQKYFVVNRSFDTGDIIADGIGCLAGWLFSRRWYIKK